MSSAHRALEKMITGTSTWRGRLGVSPITINSGQYPSLYGRYSLSIIEAKRVDYALIKLLEGTGRKF